MASEFDDIDMEIKRLMRGKSAVSINLPNKSLLDITMEKKLRPTLEDEERVKDYIILTLVAEVM